MLETRRSLATSATVRNRAVAYCAFVSGITPLHPGATVRQGARRLHLVNALPAQGWPSWWARSVAAATASRTAPRTASDSRTASPAADDDGPRVGHRPPHGAGTTEPTLDAVDGDTRDDRENSLGAHLGRLPARHLGIVGLHGQHGAVGCDRARPDGNSGMAFGEGGTN